ncbi:hypothetical protein BT96DRAFT_519438 [Gymnopus androsaceus JB14]|uniref:NACHT domain-containing protein n=1 Tax=Gymnopus androsaceus JB14 TaxID=1447944 RepID=A0A6A4GMU8_9AGAR|nr:hypothetical protein BT96DRAFT_519438 [Gymnopus androsaceus JB14]
MLANSIVLIHGRAGTGKSCIAGSLAQIIHKKQHPVLTEIELAMSFHCIRDSRDKDVSVLVPTLVYQLALEFPEFGEKLASNSHLDTSGDLSTQFDDLLFDPLMELKKEGKTKISKKIAIIVDGLDEWGQEDDRISFLTKLQTLCEMHNWMRFVITSRPNPEIGHAFLPDHSGLFKRIDLSEDERTMDDIAVYIKSYRFNHPKLKNTVSELEMLSLLPYINSLFILADVVCKFIAQSPCNNFKILANAETGYKSGRNSYDVLYSLYETVLTESLVDPINQVSIYMDVIGTLCVSQQPLTIQGLTKLTNNDARDIVESLSAVFYTDSESKIHYHLSFQEFILDNGMSNRRLGTSLYQFYLNVTKQHEHVALVCLKIMIQQLKFNICHLESSYLANEAVINPDMDQQVQRWISEELRYSCESWVYHMCETDEQSESWQNISCFMESKSIIYWMECLSCLNKTSHIKSSVGNTWPLVVRLLRTSHIPPIPSVYNTRSYTQSINLASLSPH